MKRAILFIAAAALLIGGVSRAEDGAADEVIVKFRHGHKRPTLAFQSAPMKSFGIGRRNDRARRFTDAMEDFVVIKLAPGVSVDDALNALRRRGDVDYAGPNPIVHAMTVPNDTNFGNQWGMHNTGQTVQTHVGVADADIDAPEAWDLVTGSTGVIVAIIDSGMDYAHPDLAANVWTNPGESGALATNGIDDDGNGVIDDYHGANFDRGSGAPLGDPDDSYYHGTHVAGIIGAVSNNARGVSGVAWNVRLMPLRFLDSGGNGTVAHAIEAIQYAVDKGASIINNSWSTSANDVPLHSAITAAKNAGIVIVGAAGNTSNSSTIMYPAGWDEVIAVSATTNEDTLLTYNYGPHVDLGAPGRDVGSTYPSNQYAYLSGTSMATPHVSGVAALMRSLSPSITPDQIQTILMASVDVPAGWNFNYGVGRLNAYTSVLSVGDAAPPTVSLTSPDGSAPVNGAAVALTATASDDKIVTKVWFLVDGVVISTDTSSPYSTTWNSTLVADGAHSLSARAFDGAGHISTSTLSVTVGNADPTLPTIAITSPANGATVSETISVDANATDNVGVTEVRFSLNGVVQSTDVAAAYSWPFNTRSVVNGTYTIGARSFDAIGNSSSTSISITVSNVDISSPTVAVTAPTASAQLQGVFAFTATASDNIGVSTVQFLVDGVVAVSDISFPYATTLDTLSYSTGTHALSASAYDATGNTSSHTVVVSFLSPPDVSSPTVSITAPAAAAQIYGGFSLTASASDNIGVSAVEFLVDGVLAVTDVSFPYSTPLDTVSYSSGTHSLSARAYDAAGNTSSHTVVVSFLDAPDVSSPTVTITAPTAGAQLQGSFAFTATASDNVGVSSVDFIVDGVVAASDASFPYSTSLDTLSFSTGTHALSARAFDGTGNTSSATVSISFLIAPDVSSPTVSITAPAASAQFNGVFAFTASAADNVGVSTVEFLVDGVIAAVDVSSPYSASLDTLSYSSGTHMLSVRALDAAGNSNSNSLSVVFTSTSTDGAPPSISIPGLAPGARLNGTVELTATASDNVAVVRVELYADGHLIETDATPPFRFSLNTASLGAGPHLLAMNAYDAEGNVGSTSLSIVVGGYSLAAFQPLFNPMRGEVMNIPLNLGETMRVEAKLLDRSGSMVAELANGDLAPGASLRWDGRNLAHEVAASGVYLLYLKVGGTLETRKILLRK